MVSTPIVATVKRYLCPHCGRSRSKRAATVEHIGRCWHNPENRTCKSCALFRDVPSGDPCFPGHSCRCNEGFVYCLADVELPEVLPVVECSLWQSISAEVAP